MGRRKVPMKKIEDKQSRQVTFSKRRGGLMKKARELSILCDVDVAVIIISASGRVYDLGSGDCLTKVLERYQEHLDAKDAFTCKDNESSMHRPATCDFRTSAHLLRMVQIQFDEKNINQLNIVELMQLEQQIDVTLGQTRFRKTQLLMETITTLQAEEKWMRQERQNMERMNEAKCNEDRQQDLREKDLVKELELRNYKGGDDESSDAEKPVRQIMFRLL